MAWRKMGWLVAAALIVGLAGCGKKAKETDAAKAPSTVPAPPGATVPAQQAQAAPGAATTPGTAADDSRAKDDAFVNGSPTDGQPGGAAASIKSGSKSAPAKADSEAFGGFGDSGSGGSSSADTGGASAKPTAASSSVSVSTIKDMAGLKSAVAKHRGKVVVVNFWATWCPSCVEEFPSLIKLRDSFGSKMALVTVSGDEKSDLDGKVKPFLAKHSAGRNAYLATFTDESAFASALGWSGSYPVTIIYDRKGEKVELLEGAKSYDEFADAVRKHL